LSFRDDFSERWLRRGKLIPKSAILELGSLAPVEGVVETAASFVAHVGVVCGQSTWDRRILRTHLPSPNVIWVRRAKYCLSCSALSNALFVLRRALIRPSFWNLISANSYGGLCSIGILEFNAANVLGKHGQTGNSAI